MAEKFTFKIQRSELGKYSTSGVSLNVDQDYLDKFTADAIERAKLLKAKHGNKYTDAYYLDYAKSLELQDIIGANKEIFKNRSNRCDIKDMNWAGYSYDEIIEMSNTGYKIPEEVLQWAYSMQQSDVTDYVMVSDSTTVNDETASATGAGTSELSNLQKKARQNITRTEEATEKTEQKIQEYQTTAEKAKNIKKNKENSYKDSINEINTLTKEWEKLDDKKKNGTLSKLEQKRYTDLSKKLNGTDGTLMKDIEIDNSDLEDFLGKLDGLNTEIDNNASLAQETIQSGTELSNYEKEYHQEQLPKILSGIQANGTGMLSDTLYGIKGDQIADLAIEKGGDLDELANTLTGELSNNENIKLTEFAKDYTSLASKTEEETKNAMGEEFEKPQNAQDESKKEVKTYNVDIAFTFQNAQKAAITTTQATSDLMNNNTSTASSDKKLNKELKTLQKNIKDITKESSEAEQKHEQNIQKEESFLTELETIHGKTNNESTDNKVQEPLKTSNKNKKTEDIENTPKTNNEDKKQTIIEQLETFNTEDKILQDKIQKTLSKGVQSNTKSQNLTKILTNNSNDLTKRTTNTEDVSAKTVVVGAGTFGKSFITTAIGEAMFATGISLMASPFTYSTGLALTIAGGALQFQGQQELINGIAATKAGITGLISSDIAKETNSDAKTSLKQAAVIFKENQEVFKEADNSVNSEENTDSIQPSTENSTSKENIKITDENQNTTQDEIPDTELSDSENISQTDNNESTENENETTNNQTLDKGYSVSLEFTAENSIKATQTTNQATLDLNRSKTNTDKLNKTVESETKKSANLVKDIDKENAKSEEKHNSNLQQSETITQQITSVQAQMQNASSTDEADSAQTEIENLSTQLDGTISEEEQLTNSTDKTISKSIQQLSNFKKNTQNLAKNSIDFNTKIANQLDVSQKTLGVGIGTGVNGSIHTVLGSQQITEGAILMATPFTHALGVATTAMGVLTLAQGMNEIATGTVAAATGTNGIIANGNAKDSATQSDTAEKASKMQAKDSDKQVDEAKKSLAENSQEFEQPENINQNNDEIQEKETIEDITTLAASASSNANINDTTLTDDKADRKLSRFNTESIIESKKKMKKVQAVSASSKG
uniref:Uncharacterized protein n=1 Tax=uncultured Candidatus Melainabacteria bacterium TaxID=2682970 RepID=A0A650EIW0_9BACT|nr:hypothetical protein Melaina855_0040 [uncultured Candidatus Melainabacteria bacterium]